MMKFKQAEKYRGLYNKHIDNLVDIVNENFTKLKRAIDESNTEDLMKLRILEKEMNSSFLELTDEVHKVDKERMYL